MTSDFWKTAWVRRRTQVSQAGGLVLFLIAKPRSNALFLSGLGVALLGEAVRIWASGHIRKGSSLAREGPYAMVRHPLYFGSLVMACGFALMCTSSRHWLATSVIWSSILATFYFPYSRKMAWEERELELLFEDDFRRYRAQVPPFWPAWRLWRRAARTTDWRLSQSIRNKEHETFLALWGLALVLRFKMAYRL